MSKHLPLINVSVSSRGISSGEFLGNNVVHVNNDDTGNYNCSSDGE